MSIVKLLILLALIAAPFIVLFCVPLFNFRWSKNNDR